MLCDNGMKTGVLSKQSHLEVERLNNELNDLAQDVMQKLLEAEVDMKCICCELGKFNWFYLSTAKRIEMPQKVAEVLSGIENLSVRVPEYFDILEIGALTDKVMAAYFNSVNKNAGTASGFRRRSLPFLYDTRTATIERKFTAPDRSYISTMACIYLQILFSNDVVKQVMQKQAERKFWYFKTPSGRAFKVKWTIPC